MQHPCPAAGILLEPDILPIVMGIIPASRSQVARLRRLRLVCKAFKDAVDRCRRNREWTGRFAAQAADFRGDVARTGNVHPPFSLNRGIARMLFEREWQPIIDCMKEYNSDCKTQEIVITLLLQRLEDPQAPHILQIAPGPSYEGYVSALNKYGAHGVVAWAMRTHPDSHTIQTNGCRLLYFIVNDQDELRLTPYIVGTLAGVMHANMQDLELLRACVAVLEKMLSEVPDFFRDTDSIDGIDGTSDSHAHGASDSDAGEAEGDGSSSDVESAPHDGVINMPALIQAGVHNVPNLLIRAMRQHMGDYDFQRDAAAVLYLISCIMNRLKNITCTKDFVMHEAETVLIASMHRHSHQEKYREFSSRSDSLTPNVQENCLFALQELMEFDFRSMQHIREAMQASINAAVQNGGDFVEWMISMFCRIMHKLETLPLETERMQTFAANSGMVQVYTMCILKGAPVHNLNDEDDTYHAFETLILICEGNASTSAQMVQADVVRTIDSASPVSPKSARWHKARDKLVAILENMTLGCSRAR